MALLSEAYTHTHTHTHTHPPPHTHTHTKSSSKQSFKHTCNMMCEWALTYEHHLNQGDVLKECESPPSTRTYYTSKY